MVQVEQKINRPNLVRNIIMNERKRIRNRLVAGVCVIVFKKSNGTERKLWGTLSKKYIPDEKIPTDFDKDVMVVWGVTKMDWRSFRWDSLKEFKPAPGNEVVHPNI